MTKFVNFGNSRKQWISSTDIFSFCWTLFIHIKSNFPQISDDLVNSHHLLLACIDYCFANALLLENANELLNPDFSGKKRFIFPLIPFNFNSTLDICEGLPKDFFQKDYKSNEKEVCIIQVLCDKFHGISVEAKTIKKHWCQPAIKRMTEKDILKTKNGVFDVANYENN